MAYYNPADPDGWAVSDTSSGANALKRIVGFSVFASLFEGFIGGGNANGGGGVNNAVMTSLRLFILGTIVETGRRLFQWVIERFKLFRERSLHSFLNFDRITHSARSITCCTDAVILSSSEYSITAQFQEGDPAYEWLILLLVRGSSSIILIA